MRVTKPQAHVGNLSYKGHVWWFSPIEYHVHIIPPIHQINGNIWYVNNNLGMDRKITLVHSLHLCFCAFVVQVHTLSLETSSWIESILRESKGKFYFRVSFRFHLTEATEFISNVQGAKSNRIITLLDISIKAISFSNTQ